MGSRMVFFPIIYLENSKDPLILKNSPYQWSYSYGY